MTNTEFEPPATISMRWKNLPQWGQILIIVNAATLIAVFMAVGYLTGVIKPAPTGQYEQLMGATLRWQYGRIIFDDVYNDRASEIAGIRAGDELLSINGERFDRQQQAMRLIEEFERGDRIRVTVRIAPGQVEQYLVTLGQVGPIAEEPPRPEPLPTVIIEFPTAPIGTGTLGVNYQMVGPDDPFGVTGALVISTQTGSLADRYNIQAGDIIMEVDNIELNEFTTLQDALSRYRSGDSVRLRIQSEGREQTIRVTLG